MFEHNNELFKNNLEEVEYNFLKNVAKNKTEGFTGKRDEGIAENVVYYLNRSKASNNVMLIGRSHANYSYKNAGYQLEKESSFKTSVGLILYHSSKILDGNWDKTITVDDLNDKPWKSYKNELLSENVSDFSIVPSSNGLNP